MYENNDTRVFFFFSIPFQLLQKTWTFYVCFQHFVLSALNIQFLNFQHLFFHFMKLNGLMKTILAVYIIPPLWM